MPEPDGPLVLHRGGTPGLPLLVLLHGMTDSGVCWVEAVERWGGAHETVAPDARGYGRSPRWDPTCVLPPARVHTEDHARVIAGLGGAGRPVVVGHSMGGGTAALLAARPDLVAAVVLEEPNWHLTPPSTSTCEATNAAAYEGLLAFRADPERSTAADPTAALLTERERRAWVEATLATDPEALRAHLHPGMPSWRDVVAAVAVPTLVVTGDTDVMLGPALLKGIRAVGNPLVEVAVIPGAGHCVRWSRRAEFHALVDPWLARHTEGGPA